MDDEDAALAYQQELECRQWCEECNPEFEQWLDNLENDNAESK